MKGDQYMQSMHVYLQMPQQCGMVLPFRAWGGAGAVAAGPCDGMFGRHLCMCKAQSQPSTLPTSSTMVPL